MPSISFGEILMILLAVIIFVKPEEMPRFMRSVAKTYRKVQRAFFRVRNVTHEALREVSSVGLEEEWRQGGQTRPPLIPPPASVPVTPGEASPAADNAAQASPPANAVAGEAAATPAPAAAPPANGPVPRA